MPYDMQTIEKLLAFQKQVYRAKWWYRLQCVDNSWFNVDHVEGKVPVGARLVQLFR